MDSINRNSAYFLDDVDLFSSPSTTRGNSNSLNSFGRSNSLIDSPVPVLQGDKLIDLTTDPVTPSSTTWNGASFIEEWPEVPSVNVEHKVHHSSSGSLSSQKELVSSLLHQTGTAVSQVTASNGFFFHSGKDISKELDPFERVNFGDAQGWNRGNRAISKSVNAATPAVPPKIEQRKAVLGSAPPVILTNGFAPATTGNSSVHYHRMSSNANSSTLEDLSDFVGNKVSEDNGFASVIDEGAKSEVKRAESDDDEEDDEVFLHVGPSAERAAALIPLTGNRKKKVRFFEDGITESELLVGAVPPTTSNGGAAVSMRKGRSWRPRLILLSMTLAVLLALSATVILIIYTPWKSHPSQISTRSSSTTTRSNVVCTNLNVEYLSNYSVENAYPTSALTSLCTKGGNCKNTIVFGFGTTVAVPCYGSSECRGGIASIDISTGQLLWRRSTLGEVNGVNCRDDLNRDGIADCIATGRRGVLLALNGRTGEPLWEASLDRPDAEFFTSQIVSDMDKDGVPEILATAVIRTEDYVRLYFLSGKTGEAYLKGSPYILNLKHMDTSVPAMLWRHGESLPDVIISAGSFARRGGLFNFALQALILTRLEKILEQVIEDKPGPIIHVAMRPNNGRSLYNNTVLVPPAFADLNGDSFGDMIVCTDAGQLVAIDGISVGKILWKFTAKLGQCASPLVIGQADEDDIPDVAVTFCFGEGFHWYRNCETIFVSGKTGQEIKGRPIVRSFLPPSSAGLSIRTTSQAGDIFLIWTTSCGGNEGDIGYSFVDAVPRSWRDASWSGICHQLLGRRVNRQLLAVTGGVSSPTHVFDTNVLNFDDELEKFASILEQIDPGFMFTMDKRRVASVQLGPAGMFISGQEKGTAFVDFYFPTFVSVASPVDVVAAECSHLKDDPRSCRNQFGPVYQQRLLRESGVDFAGGFLLHKLRLHCTCPSNVPCAQLVSDNDHQPWSQYLGSNMDNRFLTT